MFPFTLPEHAKSLEKGVVLIVGPRRSPTASHGARAFECDAPRARENLFWRENFEISFFFSKCDEQHRRHHGNDDDVKRVQRDWSESDESVRECVTQVLFTAITFDVRQRFRTSSGISVRARFRRHDVVFVRPKRIFTVDDLSHAGNSGRIHVEMVGVLVQERLASAVSGDEIRRRGRGQSSRFSTTARTETVAVKEQKIPI